MLPHGAHILCITSEMYICTTTRHSERHIRNTRMHRIQSYRTKHPEHTDVSPSVTLKDTSEIYGCIVSSHSERHIRNAWIYSLKSQNDTFGTYECIASSHSERHIRNLRMHQSLNMTRPEQVNVSVIHSERHIQNIGMHHIHSLRATVRYHSW